MAVPEDILHEDLRLADIFLIPAGPKLQSVELGPKISLAYTADLHKASSDLFFSGCLPGLYARPREYIPAAAVREPAKAAFAVLFARFSLR